MVATMVPSCPEPTIQPVPLATPLNGLLAIAVGVAWCHVYVLNTLGDGGICDQKRPLLQAKTMRPTSGITSIFWMVAHGGASWTGYQLSSGNPEEVSVSQRTYPGDEGDAS